MKQVLVLAAMLMLSGRSFAQAPVSPAPTTATPKVEGESVTKEKVKEDKQKLVADKKSGASNEQIKADKKALKADRKALRKSKKTDK
jgi:hypothetical protein